MDDENKGCLLWALIIAVIWLIIYLFGGASPSSIDPLDGSYYDPGSSEEGPTYSTPTFHGYSCTQDCSGHEAGYSWAEDHDITDPDDCGGNSESFIEGCQSYAEENGYSGE